MSKLLVLRKHHLCHSSISLHLILTIPCDLKKASLFFLQGILILLTFWRWNLVRNFTKFMATSFKSSPRRDSNILVLESQTFQTKLPSNTGVWKLSTMPRLPRVYPVYITLMKTMSAPNTTKSITVSPFCPSCNRWCLKTCEDCPKPSSISSPSPSTASQNHGRQQLKLKNEPPAPEPPEPPKPRCRFLGRKSGELRKGDVFSMRCEN